MFYDNNQMIKILLIGALILIAQSIQNKMLPDSIRCGGDDTPYSGAMFNIYSTNQSKIIFYCQIWHGEERCVGFNVDGGNYVSGVGHYDSRKGCQKKSLSTLDKQNRTIYYALDPSMHKNQTKLDEENALKNKITKLEEREAIKDKNMIKKEEEEATAKKKMEKMEEENAAFKNIITKMGEEVAAIKNKITKMEQQQSIKDKKIEKLQNKISDLKKKLSSFSANFWEYEQIKQTWLRDFEEKIVGNIKSKGLQIGSRWKLQQQGNSFVIRDSVGSNAKDSRIAFPADTFMNPK